MSFIAQQHTHTHFILINTERKKPLYLINFFTLSKKVTMNEEVIKIRLIAAKNRNRTEVRP